MANTFRIKRRTSGGAGAPSSLANAELAFNEVGDILYYGKGTGGAGGTATTVEPIGGKGAFLDLSSDQTAIGNKTFNGSVTIDGSLVQFTVSGGATVGMSSAAAVFVPTPAAGSNSTNAATTAWVRGFAQPLDAELTAIAAISTNGLFARTGAGTAAARTLTGTSGRISVSNGDGVSGNPTIDLSASGVTAGTYTKITVDNYGRATVGATALLSELSAPTSAVSFNNQKITNLATPTAATDAATKGYVDTAVQGLDVKASVKVCATTMTGITLVSGQVPTGSATIDGVVTSTNDRVLITAHSISQYNGIWLANTGGTWSRPADFNTGTSAAGAFVFVEQGVVNADSGWVCTSDPSDIIGTDPLTWSQFSGAGQITAGAGMTKTGNTLDIGAGTGITVNADSIQISASYAGQTSITTLGTIATGTWNATTIALNKGGTGATTASAARTNLGLVIGTDVQAWNGILQDLVNDIPGLGSSGSMVPFRDLAGGTWGYAILNTTGIALLGAATAAAARTTLGLGTIATQNASAVAITGGSIDNITLDGGSF